MKKFSDLKLKYKILLTMLPLLICLVLIISISCGAYFSYTSEKDIERSEEAWFAIIQQRLDHIVTRIRSSLIMKLSSSKLSAINQKMLSNESSKLIIQAELQETLGSIKQIDRMIDDAFIIDSSNDLYLSYSSSIINPESPVFDYSAFSSENSLTIMPCMPSPVKKDEYAIPVAVSLKTLYPSSSYLAISNEPDPEMVLVLLLDADELWNELNSISSEYFDVCCTLSFNGKSIYPIGNQDMEKNMLKSSTQLDGLDLIMYFDTGIAESKKTGIICFIIIISSAIIAIGLIGILYFSDFLTRPFKKLSRMINRIKDNAYELDEKAEFSDETGELIESINSMYVTIQDQIQQIKAEEKEKYQYMEQVLTEQINPHFIYNTLEIINMEVMNGNIDSASSMIQTFASYLRCSLNKGNGITTLKDEISQVNAYMRIMNQRLNKRVSFSISCPEQLYDLKIPKLIFQPLAENAIKHGFSNMRDPAVLSPAIRIEITGKADGQTEICVIDNGKGIDNERFKSALRNRSSSIGLYNVSRRLELFFASSSISAESIPYYMNTVRITVTQDK